jgi:hypothetical protein
MIQDIDSTRHKSHMIATITPGSHVHTKLFSKLAYLPIILLKIDNNLVYSTLHISGYWWRSDRKRTTNRKYLGGCTRWNVQRWEACKSNAVKMSAIK